MSKYKVGFLSEAKETFSLALPMVMGQVGMMALSLVDTAMVGHYSLEDLAGVAFGGGLMLFAIVIGMGLCSAVHVLVARAAVEKDHQSATKYLVHGVWIVCLYSLPIALLVTFWPNLLHYFGQPEVVVEHAKQYTVYMAWSVVPGLAFRCFRNYSEAWGRPWVPFFITLGAIVLNVFFNWVLIFGNLGLPEMGAAGAGLGTLLARVFSLGICIFIMMNPKSRNLKLGLIDWFAFDCGIFIRMLRIGVPTLVQISFEFGFFTVAMIMVGWVGETELASQLIVTNYTAFMFMIPLGLAFATTVRVSHALGKKEPRIVRHIGHNGIFLGAFSGLVFACITFIFRNQIPYFFVEDLGVIQTVSFILLFAAFLQFWDGVQVTAMGALRGMQDLMIPLCIVFVSYWVIGIPFGYYLAFIKEMGVAGIWIGLIVGLSIGGCLLTARFDYKTKVLLKSE